jgi:hypothetical protein
MIEYFILILSIPLGLFLKYLTDDEKPIYKKYFPAILWALAIASAIFYTLNLKTALILTFLFITVLVWNYK